jgi:3',5'-cyclic AMP phosphodiesterase CpdA
MKKILLILLYTFTALLAVEPKRIILNVSENPQSCVAVSFRFYEKVDTAFVHVTKNTADVKLHMHCDTLKVSPQIVYTDTTNTVAQFACSVYMDNLEASTEYAYRVGDGTDWSPWYTFTTASKEKYNFSMVYLGDPQWGYKTYLPRLYSAAIKEAPDAGLWYIAGDLVDYPYQDWQWDAYFEGAEPAFTQYPHMMCVGNHAYLWAYRVHRDTLPATWRPHLTQPENGPEGLEETCFYIDYQGVRFIMLNGNEHLEEQAIWLKKVLKKNKNRWTVVGIHQGFYPCGWERDYPLYRELFIPLFEKYGVQLVLQGHDHSYTRTYPLKSGLIVDDPSEGVNYIISVSGSKQYPIKSKFDSLYVHKGLEGQQYFQTVHFTKDSLVYKSFTVNGECQDKLVVKK